MTNLTIRIEGDTEVDPLMMRIDTLAANMGVRPTTAVRILIKEALDARGASSKGPWTRDD